MMRLVSWLIGFSLGAAVGAVAVMLLAPMSSSEVRQRLRAGYEETMEAARLASEQRRRELETELAIKQGKLPANVDI
jgi:gas vesicle protein